MFQGFLCYIKILCSIDVEVESGVKQMNKHKSASIDKKLEVANKIGISIPKVYKGNCLEARMVTKV